ncbi:MAG TPA: type II toxin-antitoxin system HicA family toxin [Ktedonobacterales bacterium]|nr:type II toxin-antitoxin system HicA family toxin [Ktedonobacterales bacterium]
MPRKIRQLKADMLKAGCIRRPAKGSHTVWGHPLIADTITLAGHVGDDAKRYQEKAVQGLIAKVREAERQP